MVQERNERDYSLIRIKDLKVFAHHGVLEEETVNGQDFYVCVDAYQNISPAATLDELVLTTDYSDLCRHINTFLTENTFKLLETAVEELCKSLLLKYSLIESVVVEIKKPQAPIGLPVEYASVVRKMCRHRALLSLGSNMEDREKHLKKAIEELDAEPATGVVRISSIMETLPYGYKEQDKFMNCAVEVTTLLSPRELLIFTQGIEQKHGRERKIHWGPRTLDIDIVFYDDLVYGDDVLQIPHIDMQNRYFVLKPLSEIEPGYRHPLLDKTVIQLLFELEEKISDADK
ncbi:MAG: 2-amino-4-hydroxy-6-hydroxymethyldihydropteridine diphosphokinase [Lachnospiraceae bacterium]|nr:2-amino-4-hydroxy-6-hydroxymethyldihydropteridine diphosphokinase [Lachnospiraceae bacterium]